MYWLNINLKNRQYYYNTMSQNNNIKKSVEKETDCIEIVKNINNVDNGNQNIEVIQKKKKKPPCKNVLFRKEQSEILNKLHQITKFDGKMTMFYVDDISENDRKIINNLVDDIRKFYKAIVWKCIENKDTEKVWILLLKYVYKYTGHKVTQFIDRKTENKIVTKRMRIIIENSD